MNHSIKQLHWVWLVWLIWFNSFDLQTLTTFTAGAYSFFHTRSLTLSSTLPLPFSSNVPFTNGKYTGSNRKDMYGYWTFRHITSSSITSDSSTPSPPSSLSLTTPQIRHSYSTRQILNPTTNPSSPPFPTFKLFSLFVTPTSPSPSPHSTISQTS